MLKLQLQKSIEINPTQPFNFDATFHKPDHFPSRDNDWEPGIKWQTWLWEKVSLGIKFIQDRNNLKVEIYAEKELDDNFVESLREEIVYKFNLNLDLTNFYNEFKDDELLGPVITRWKGLRPAHQGSLYEYLIIGTVLQNATIKRSVQMLQNLFENFGTLVEFDGKQLYCFWKAGDLKDVPEEKLRKIKLGYRAKTIKRLDDNFLEGSIDEGNLRNEPMAIQKK